MLSLVAFVFFAATETVLFFNDLFSRMLAASKPTPNNSPVNSRLFCENKNNEELLLLLFLLLLLYLEELCSLLLCALVLFFGGLAHKSRSNALNASVGREDDDETVLEDVLLLLLLLLFA